MRRPFRFQRPTNSRRASSPRACSAPLPSDPPLRQLDNVVLRSHLGWLADLTYSYFAQAFVAIIEAYLDGTYAGAVNLEVRQHRKGR